jgi:hypothetical protein
VKTVWQILDVQKLDLGIIRLKVIHSISILIRSLVYRKALAYAEKRGLSARGADQIQFETLILEGHTQRENVPCTPDTVGLSEV